MQLTQLEIQYHVCLKPSPQKESSITVKGRAADVQKAVEALDDLKNEIEETLPIENEQFVR